MATKKTKTTQPVPKKAKAEVRAALNVFEVEMETGIPGYRFEQHVRAKDEKDATARVQAAQGPSAEIIGVRFRRACTPAEIGGG